MAEKTGTKTKKAQAKPVKLSKEEQLQEKFEAELDIALIYIFEIFHKYKPILNTYIDYEGDYDDGPSFHVAINTDKKGKLDCADINLGFKNLTKFVKSLQA